MQNKEIFIEKLNTCGETKYEMSEVHGTFMSGIKTIYNLVFKREKKDFLFFKNMMYFKGGTEASDKPKLHVFLDSFINLVNHFDFIESNEVKKYLNAAGVDVNIVKPQFEDGPIIVDKEDRKKYGRTWKYAMLNMEEPESKKKMLAELIDRALSIQKTIEDKKDDIDKEADTVQVECMVKKPYFNKAVQIRVKEMKKKSVDNEIKKVEDAIEASQEIIEVFGASNAND